MTSIIIPAHNEENVVDKTLAPLLPGAEAGDFEVIVVCNGCTDDTAKVVAGFGGGIRCIETPVASKTHALNIGDEAATSFPRFYLDADVVLTPKAVQTAAKTLTDGNAMAAAPIMQMDYAHSSWAVRSFYDIWQSLPYVQDGMIGVGVYALSEKGRARFDHFPDIIADDRYIRALYQEHERTVVPSCVSTVRAPNTLWSLIKIKTRSRLGGYEFEKKFPHLIKNEVKDYRSAVWESLLKITDWPKLPVYLFVNLFCRLRAKRQLQNKNTSFWERDESSRNR